MSRKSGKVFKTAIIGCGKIAGGYDRSVRTEWSLTHAGAYHLCLSTKLVAVADPDFDTLKAFQEKWHIDQGYTDYREMLENETIDILSLPLPTEYHFEAFKAAVEHDISAIFCMAGILVLEQAMIFLNIMQQSSPINKV